MLHYFILVLEGLLLPAIVIGLIYAWVGERFDETCKKFLHIGFGLGLIMGALLSYIKNHTGRINVSTWNLYNYPVPLIATLVFAVFCIPIIRKSLGKRAETVLSILGALVIATNLALFTQSVFAYPSQFSLGGASMMSSAFFTRFAGVILGVIVAIVCVISVSRAGQRVTGKALSVILALGLVVSCLRVGSIVLQTLYAKRIVSGHFLFEIVKFTSNRSNIFLYAIMAVALAISVLIFARSINVNEPYENSAEHRKIKAKWRNAKRWSGTVVACALIGVITLTAFAYVDGKEIELSPVEDCEIDGDNVYVSLAQVEDGHLHRFAYTTKDNITVRFIVIKKPNSSMYGVGLDACDICGETGYFERNGQIVCKLCDVVMNINTIGFKGGCNPIVIDYSVDNGYIVVPIRGLEEHQDEFKA